MTAEIVVSFALLVAAGLVARSILNLGTHEYGFAMEDVFTARVVLPERRYADADSRARFAGGLQERIASLPAVRSATLASALPGLRADRTAVALDGPGFEDPSRYPVVGTASIAPRFAPPRRSPAAAGRSRAADRAARR